MYVRTYVPICVNLEEWILLNARKSLQGMINVKQGLPVKWQMPRRD